jgi:hypothetical protein
VFPRECEIFEALFFGKNIVNKDPRARAGSHLKLGLPLSKQEQGKAARVIKEVNSYCMFFVFMETNLRRLVVVQRQ